MFIWMRRGNMRVRRFRNVLFAVTVLSYFLIAASIAVARGQDEGVVRHFSSNDTPAASQLSAANTILPGERIGIFNFNMTPQDFKLLAGTPDAVYDRTNRAFASLSEGETYNLYKSYGLAFVFHENRVLRMIAVSPQYRVAVSGEVKSIGVGDPEAAVKQAYQAGAATRETDTHREYVFADRGISFTVLKSNGTVWEISVFKPVR
jgi:hypothetical protein